MITKKQHDNIMDMLMNPDPITYDKYTNMLKDMLDRVGKGETISEEEHQEFDKLLEEFVYRSGSKNALNRYKKKEEDDL